MNAALPPLPDFEHVRKQAKALLRAAESADPTALARLRVVPRLAPLADAEIAEQAQLADAQHAIARERGAESWPKLKAAFEAGLPVATKAEYFLRHVRDDQPAAALDWLERDPAIAGFNAFTAAAAGDAGTLERLLAADPSLATATHSPRAFTPLLYAACSPRPADTPQLTRIAQALLAAGADARAAYPGEGEGPPQTALYRACIAGHAGVARALLAHGAPTQDGESIYHAAERNQVACLEALRDAGADFGAVQQPWGNTPLYFLSSITADSREAPAAHAGIRWLLEHGADPNVRSYAHGETPLHQAARFGAGLDVARLLLAHGADPNAARLDAPTTPYAIAYRRGDDALCALLREHGAREELVPFDRILGAALRGNDAEARALAAEHPRALAEASEDQRGALHLTMAALHERGLALLLDLGMDLSWEGPWGGTLLHWAAWRGVVPLVKQLVERGAPLDLRDKTYGSSPLAWCAHGSRFCREADEDYLEIARVLLDAGSSRDATINRWGEPPESMARPRIARLIEKHWGLPRA
jgi:ankyrin repeat protein